MTDRITFDENDPSASPRIRDLPITVSDVYCDLHMKLGSAEKVLEKYPELDRDDLAAVDAYIADTIRSRTRDDVTGRPLLPKQKLRHGVYYKGRCRNATIARWNADEQRFYHWREKFGHIYIERILYPTDENEPWWDVFFTYEELPLPKFEIPFDCGASFAGTAEDLFEFDDEMWGRLPGYFGRKRERIE